MPRKKKSRSQPKSKHAAQVEPRIIGGRLRGSKLAYSGDPRTRPMKERVREDYRSYFAGEADRKLKNDIVLSLLEEAKLPLPEDFLKRWLLNVNQEKEVTAEQIEAEY